jgi:carbon starvation protein
MLSDGLANLGGPLKRLRNPSWRVGAWICSLLVVAGWGSILLMGVTDPLGGINTLYPLFGIANQLLAAIALTVVTVIVVKRGRGTSNLKWALVPGIPLLWDLSVTMTASWQKIFSPDPRVGYWTQHFAYRDAERAGKTSFGSAADPAQLHDVVRNTFIQGSLSIVFAALVAVVFVTGVLVCIKAIRGSTPTTEAAPVLSRRFAPAGLIASAAERKVQAQWDAHTG